ncbi:hypothetical protein UPYG_G00251760 [Umbra pygmaea]|uniref:Phospholamban n=1 Tax=Umbra pygmaea TaxID=75934 RepID=A0ABD0WRI1_UMBPY
MERITGSEGLRVQNWRWCPRWVRMKGTRPEKILACLWTDNFLGVVTFSSSGLQARWRSSDPPVRWTPEPILPPPSASNTSTLRTSSHQSCTTLWPPLGRLQPFHSHSAPPSTRPDQQQPHSMDKVQHTMRSAIRRASMVVDIPPHAKQNLQELFVNFSLILICLLLIYIIVLLIPL